jgi:hypothetical protein
MIHATGHAGSARIRRLTAGHGTFVECLGGDPTRRLNGDRMYCEICQQLDGQHRSADNQHFNQGSCAHYTSPRNSLAAYQASGAGLWFPRVAHPCGNLFSLMLPIEHMFSPMTVFRVSLAAWRCLPRCVELRPRSIRSRCERRPGSHANRQAEQAQRQD